MSGRGGTATILLLTLVLVGSPDHLNPDERAASVYYTRELVNLCINLDITERKSKSLFHLRESSCYFPIVETIAQST
jgi:hypothetical protein